MTMTHYMELLASNQPWNLLLFMAVPVIAAETVAITELFILFGRNMNSGLRKVNQIAGTFGGIYFLGVFVYLMVTAVIPLTTQMQWRGATDVLAVGFYLLGIVPLGGISLLELGFIGRRRNEDGRLKLHATFVAIFLVTAHIAMILGMLDPTVFSGGSMSHMKM